MYATGDAPSLPKGRSLLSGHVIVMVMGSVARMVEATVVVAESLAAPR